MTVPLDLLDAIVRGDAVTAASLEALDPSAVCDSAEEQGVLPLVADQLGRRSDLPAGLRDRLRHERERMLVQDLAREAELRSVLRAIGGAGVPALLFKGAQLAYSHYSRPDLRPRIDTDLLVRDDDRHAVEDVLSASGYEREGQVDGELVTYQSAYTKVCEGIPHTLDVHRKIANPTVFAEVFSFDDLASRAVPLPGLGASATGLSEVDALLVACLHRVAHHRNSDRLIWLYDIHLIASRLGDDDWRRFAEDSAARRLSAVCRQSLEQTVRRLGTPVPGVVWTGLSRSEQRREPSARYLRDRRRVVAVFDDLRSLPSWRCRWRLAREHLFPSVRYMRDVYAPASASPLALLYARRVFRGARKWFTRVP